MAAQDRVSSTATPSTLLVQTPSDFSRFGGRELSSHERRRVQQMHEHAPAIVDVAHDAGIGICYLGVSELFNQTRIYRGVDTDWVLAPADDQEPAVLPREQQQALRKLVAANVALFLTYIAHEVDRSKSTELVPQLAQLGQTVVTHERASELVGPVPQHPGTAEVARRLDQYSTTALSAIRKGAPIAGAALLGVLAAPFLVAGAVVGSLATLDPILIGAVPILGTEVGQPAAFFELARWDW